jgi:PEP-CTERM motif
MKSAFSRTWAALALGLVLVGSPSAWAQPVGTQGFVDVNTPTANSSDIALATSFTIGSNSLLITTNSSTGIFVGLTTAAVTGASGSTFTVTPTLDHTTSNTTFSFGNSAFGSFTSTESELTAVTTGSSSASVTYLFEGNWTAGTYPTAFTGNTYPASVTLTINQTGGPGSALSVGGTFAVPPTPVTVVPEPSTMAIAGLGALGLIGYGIRRRKGA